jgi:L-seryl-tRNA(Ser) seleniumtransferase
MTSRFREIPSVNQVLQQTEVSDLISEYSHNSIVELVRDELAAARQSVASGGEPPSLDSISNSVTKRAASRWKSWPETVINATGVILHTNLGRAPLSDESIEAASVAAAGYSDLEFDLESGRRGSRQAHISRLVCQATGAEAALVVNNNASAVMLGLAAIAAGKEVIVSRGEAVEIGGGFRIPDVLRQSGATLVEVGTTNRTYARDFEAAINENTGAVLSVHASNFHVMGFTHAPTTAELVEVGDRNGVPVLHDLGSGCLLDTRPYGLAWEPRPQESVRAGVALGFFSGDKLLGGPQAGIIVGKREYVDIVSAHPLARAVRIDKMSMASLSATMLHYIRDDSTEKVPIWRMISAPLDKLRARASDWKGSVGHWAEIVESRAAIGGGSLPGETIESVALQIDCGSIGQSAEGVLTRLRQHDQPIIGRIEDDHVLLDTRTVLPAQDKAVSSALQSLIPN